MVVYGCFFNTYSIIMIPTQNININVEIQNCKNISVEMVKLTELLAKLVHLMVTDTCNSAN